MTPKMRAAGTPGRLLHTCVDGHRPLLVSPVHGALQCQALVGSLAATQLCFSCAHGRPTTAPVVDLRLLRRALQLRAAAQLRSDGAKEEGDGGTPGRVALSGLKAKLQQLVG